jgi:DNA-binding transcriptional MerR regulator
MDIHIGAAAQRSGLSVDAIRYYESLDLIEGARRDPGGRRIFSPDDVRWLVFLRAMRETGMPIAEVQEYVRCRRAGATGVDGMLAVLRRHRDMIDVHQARLARCAELVEAKIAKYEDLSVTGQPPGPPEVDLE